MLAGRFPSPACEFPLRGQAVFRVKESRDEVRQVFLTLGSLRPVPGTRYPVPVVREEELSGGPGVGEGSRVLVCRVVG